MASNEGLRRNPNMRPHHNEAVVTDHRVHEDIFPLDGKVQHVIPDSQGEKNLQNSTDKSAADASAVKVETKTEYEDTAASDPLGKIVIIPHDPKAGTKRPPKRCIVTARRAESPLAKKLTVAQLEEEDMINVRNWNSGLTIKFYRKHIDQFLAQCESALLLWGVKSEFVRAMLVFQQIPYDLRYEWALFPPVRGDLKAYQTLTQTLRKKGKKINKVERGIDAMWKLKNSSERPEVIAKKLVKMVGVPNAELDKTWEDMQEFLKCCLLDTLPTATADALRVTCTDMSFTKLVEKADELYKSDPLPNPYEADTVNAMSRHAGNRQSRAERGSGNSRGRGGGKDTSQSKDLANWEDQFKSLQNEIRKLKNASDASNQTAVKPKPFYCWVHKIHGKRAKFCAEPDKCQWIDYRKQQNQDNAKGAQPFLDHT